MSVSLRDDPQQIQINRRTQVERVHLHYQGRSEVEVRGAAADRTQPVNRSTSWVDIRRGFLKDPDGVFSSVLDTTRWTKGETWRYERYVAEQRLGAVIRRDAQQDSIRQTGLHLRSAYLSPLSGVAAILYRDGTDFQGLHSDRGLKWLDQTLIAILVLGERRPFLLRPRYPISKGEKERRAGTPEETAEDVEIRPGFGDLIVMGGRCQRDWLHSVPACDATKERISLTWRWTSRTGKPDTGASFGEGVHYSDAKSRPFRRTRPV